MWHNFYMVRENMYVEDVLEKKFHSWPKSVVNWSYTGWQNKVVANNTTDEEENCVTSFSVLDHYLIALFWFLIATLYNTNCMVLLKRF